MRWVRASSYAALLPQFLAAGELGVSATDKRKKDRG